MSNTIIITGNLGRDPERQREGAGPVILNLADSVGFGDRKTTTWRRVAVWGKTGDYCLTALSKGDLVTVTGEESQRVWTDKEGKERTTSEVNARAGDGPFRRVTREERGGYSAAGDRSKPAGYSGGGFADGDDIPF